MITTTQRLRRTAPHTFVRKDARNQTLRLVYGSMTDQRGQKRIAASYRSQEDWDQAHNTIRHLMPITQWPKSKVDQVYSDLGALNPKSVHAPMQEAA
jgi:hypothetical protein